MAREPRATGIGRRPDEGVARRLGPGAEAPCRFAPPIVSRAGGPRGDGAGEVLLARKARLDRPAVQEELTSGGHTQHFVRQVAPREPTGLVSAYRGENIGRTTICQVLLITDRELRLRILESGGPVGLRRLDTYCVAGEQ